MVDVAVVVIRTGVVVGDIVGVADVAVVVNDALIDVAAREYLF